MELDKISIFSAGEKNEAYAKYFTGQSYLNMLTTEGKDGGGQLICPSCCGGSGRRNSE